MRRLSTSTTTLKSSLLDHLRHRSFVKLAPSRIAGVGVVAVRDIPPDTDPFLPPNAHLLPPEPPSARGGGGGDPALALHSRIAPPAEEAPSSSCSALEPALGDTESCTPVSPFSSSDGGGSHDQGASVGGVGADAPAPAPAVEIVSEMTP